MSIAPKALLPFFTKALSDMVDIAVELGDARINLRPDLPNTNSPYAIMTHCVGSTNDWLGSVLAGRAIVRDREAEFSAEGTVAEIIKAIRELQQQSEEDIIQVRGDQSLGYRVDLHGSMQEHTQGDVLLHCLRELTQHLGQLELTRDILRAR